MSDTQNTIQCRLRFRETADTSGISAEQHAETQGVLAEALHCRLDDIHIIDVQEDGRLLMLDMPATLFEKFLKLGESDEQWLQKLGILLVKEILEEPYDISRIRLLLSKMFPEEELRSFCRQYFPDVSLKLSTDMKKAQMIEALLDFARQTSRIPHILVLAEQRNAESFKKYEPYYLPPRIFPSSKKKSAPRTSSFSPPFFNLTLQEFLRASILGSGLTAGLTFLLRRTMMVANDVFLMYLLMGGIALIGMLTGETVLKLVNYKRGRFPAIVGVGSYLFGSFLGNGLLAFTMMGFQLSLDSLVSVFAIGLTGTISSGLALLIGMFLAYKYTR
ncbi:MAG: hypothetical protein GY801_19920 [bacterium]|nr:hypothetical protein [bacterium]